VQARAAGIVKTIAIVAYPRISNLDEFQALKNVPGVRLVWVRSPSELAGVDADDWIILPGSKHTSSDLAWLRKQGLDAAITRHAGQGGAVLGICGGLQMLGEALLDPQGVEHAYLGNAPGLGLLPLVTVFEPGKTLQQTSAVFDFGKGTTKPGLRKNPWALLDGVTVTGYEIHHGQTLQHVAMAQAGDIAVAVMSKNLAWCNTKGNVMGCYLHGLFEDAAVLQALFGVSCPTLDSVFEVLADFIESHFQPGVLGSFVSGRPPPD
jgi:adenosylcobyric acid synthase